MTDNETKNSVVDSKQNYINEPSIENKKNQKRKRKDEDINVCDEDVISRVFPVRIVSRPTGEIEDIDDKGLVFAVNPKQYKRLLERREARERMKAFYVENSTVRISHIRKSSPSCPSLSSLSSSSSSSSSSS